MWSRRLSTPLAALSVLGLSAALAPAADLAGFDAAVEQMASHNRAAIGYLRTETMELAALEIARANEAWKAVAEKFGNDRPAAFTNNALYVPMMVEVPTQLAGASHNTAMGQADSARKTLEGVRKRLSALRRASGHLVLADCVLDFNTAMEPIARWDTEPPDLGNPAQAAQ